MDINKLDGLSMDLENANMEKLKSVFPECFSEGKLDIDKLLSLCGEYIDNDFEKYKFEWKGKSECLRLAQKRSTGTLRPCKEKSVNFDDTQNVYIEGDNLEVLKLLQTAYFNKIKMIYIDPPYNTGNDFVYEDDFADPMARYKEVTQQTTKSNPETMGRYHTNWLNMMYPRLRLAANLLKEDGVIFISIDDNEVFNLKKVCDEVFGEENFVGTVIIKSNPRGSMSVSQLAQQHEYLVIYAKNIISSNIIGHELSEDMTSEYKYEDEKGKYRLLGLRQRGGFWRRSERPLLYYPIYVNTSNGELSLNQDENFTYKVVPYQPSSGEDGTWRWSKEKFENEKCDLIGKAIKRNGKDDWDIFQKDYIGKNGTEIRRTKAKSLWDDKELNYQNGTIEIKNLFESGNVFPFPKPTSVIGKALSMIGFEENDIILDFFSGSATTAHAVMQLIEYKISGRDLYPYYNDYLPLYIGNGGADIEINNAKTFNIDGLKKEISLDFSPLLCSYIMGTVKLPDGIAPSENTYFQVKVTADGDSYNNYDYVRFDEGENENEYSIEIPQVYANLSYAVSCFVGDEADIPSPPVQTALKDTSFIMPESSSGGGGGGRPGNYKKRVIPSDVVQGIPRYFSTAGATYDLSLAEKIKMADIDSYNADLTVGSISEKHPRTIGGYFCDIYGGTDATIQLCDSETNEVLDSVDVNETGNYAFYELNTDTLNDVYIRYLYDEKERFYSNASNLTDSIDEAVIIPTASEAVKYGYDVYKDNTKYKNFNDRYFEYEIIGFDYPYGELHFSLFDKMGNKIESVEGGRIGRFTTSVCDVLIGFEFGGKTYYFSEKPTYTRYKEPALKSFSENINSAFMYRLPHSSYRVFVTIDLSDFISGQLLDKNGKSIVNESYFNYSDESNGIYVSEMYIDVNDEVFQSGGTVYVGIYDKTGRLLGLRAITTHPQNNTVPIDEILPNGGYIKIMPWGKNINPLSNADKFFD